jgi:putative DNA primase/helicase
VTLALRSLAHALAGEVSGNQVLAPGPGHGPRDRSLSIKLSATAPDGWIAFSFAGDPWHLCKDHVRQCLGIRFEPRQQPSRPAPRPIAAPPLADDKTGPALALWRQGIDPRGTLVERYLSSRALDLGDDVAGEVLRWHPGIGAMLALFRDIVSDEPRAVSRTFLDRERRKLSRKFLGPVGGAAIKLDADENVLGGLHISEGAETGMAARQLGLRPTWALGSAGAIGAFPVLSGIECLTILAENDDASARSVETCWTRWRAAGREACIIYPTDGSDLNDAIRGSP